MTGYNGWTNRETWLANLWIDNDGWDGHFRELAKDALRDEDGDKDAAALSVREALKDWLDEERAAALPSSGLLSDLLAAAVDNVNLYEIVYHWLDEAEEELEEE